MYCKINSVQYEFINSLFLLTMYMPIFNQYSSAVGNKASVEVGEDSLLSAMSSQTGGPEITFTEHLV